MLCIEKTLVLDVHSFADFPQVFSLLMYVANGSQIFNCELLGRFGRLYIQSQLLFIIMWVWKYLQYTTKNFFILRTRKEKSHKNTTMTHFFRTFPHDIPHLPLPLLVPISRPQKPFRNQETLHPHPKWLWFASLKTVPSLAKEAVVPVGPFTSLAWRFGGFFTRFGLATKPGSHNCYLKIVWENHSRGLKSNWIKAINYSIY